MNIQITGKDLKATEAIKNYVEKKLERIEKYFDTEDMEVFVTIKAERELQIAELSVGYKGERFRAVTEHKDLYASIDKDIDVLEGQIRKAKTKKEKQNKEDSIKLKEIANSENKNEISGEIIKAIYYEIKPISVDDAKLKLQEKPTNNFLTFINVDTNKVNVIFKLKDGKNFGLVEPEA
ncbi:MAG: ribosome-associated translation inhibitor RaiA [Clostridia bacterium]|nr:ribosome-associated translation inhibitor RaiA [Clostridia bacterium]